LISIDTPFVDALETLFCHRISGLALIDQEYHISGNFSVGDLRGMKPYGFEYFTGSVLQFLAKGTSSRGPIGTIQVDEYTTFGEVVKLLDEQHLHRVFVSDGSNHPLGQISLGDILVKLTHF